MFMCVCVCGFVVYIWLLFVFPANVIAIFDAEREEWFDDDDKGAFNRCRIIKLAANN